VSALLAAETPAPAGSLQKRADGWWLKGLSLTNNDPAGIVHPRFQGSARSPERLVPGLVSVPAPAFQTLWPALGSAKNPLCHRQAIMVAEKDHVDRGEDARARLAIFIGS